jgi:cullin-associated NEDD8-dissociated protein 1
MRQDLCPAPPTCPRARRYGTPQPFVSAFAPSRGGGEAAFGILEWGGCGYTNSYGGQGSLAFAKESVGAYSDQNEDSAGGCQLGRLGSWC